MRPPSPHRGPHPKGGTRGHVQPEHLTAQPPERRACVNLLSSNLKNSRTSRTSARRSEELPLPRSQTSVGPLRKSFFIDQHWLFRATLCDSGRR